MPAPLCPKPSDRTAAPDPPDASLPHEPYAALDRLNSFVRSRRFWGEQRYLLNHIYGMKRQAIVTAHAAGIATHRRVRVTVNCRDCGGTGQYISQSGDPFDHCWQCSSTGRTTLHFAETAIAGGPTWHSPSIKFPYDIEVALGWYEAENRWSDQNTTDVTGDWAPNQPGRPLEPVALAEALLGAEDAFFWPLFKDALPHRVRALHTQASYRLPLETDPPRCCRFCNWDFAPDDGKRAAIPIQWSRKEDIPPISWYVLVCPDCEKIHKPLLKYKGVITPPDIVEHPSIQRWGAAHRGLIPPPYQHEDW